MFPFQVKNCTVGIVDDKHFESNEIFYVKLARPHGIDSVAKLGEINTTEITITNKDDGRSYI